MIPFDAKMIGILKRVWDSPTITTWASLLARLGSMFLLLPWVLRSLSANEVAVWLLFTSIASLQIICDAGFSQTFTRAFGNARGGAELSGLARIGVASPEKKNNGVNHRTLQALLIAIHPIYFRVSVFCFFLLVLGGSVSIYPQIRGLEKASAAWIAWAVVVGVTTVSVWGNIYQSYLLGSEKISILRRWETIFAICGVLSGVVALLTGGGLIELVVVQQLWVIASVLRNRWLCRRDNDFKNNGEFGEDAQLVFSILWPSAWRSGIGVLMSFGVIQISGVLYARVATGFELGTYLLSLRVIQLISQVSQAPFYSKLPSLSRLYAQGDVSGIRSIAQRGMLISIVVFGLGFASAGVFSSYLLERIGSSTKFASPLLWALLGSGFLLERIGAMHLQLYTTSNHVVWHIANGVTGCIMLVLAYIMYPMLGIYAFPVAMIAGYSLFYCPYSMGKSYREFQLKFPQFEFFSSAPGVLIVLIIFAFALLCS